MTTPSPIEQARAEITSVIETADKIAHEGLQAGADGPRVLGGLILQLATQVERSLDLLHPDSGKGGAIAASPNELESPTEEDSTPQDAPAAPRRQI